MANPRSRTKVLTSGLVLKAKNYRAYHNLDTCSRLSLTRAYPGVFLRLTFTLHMHYRISKKYQEHLNILKFKDTLCFVGLDWMRIYNSCRAALTENIRFSVMAIGDEFLAVPCLPDKNGIHIIHVLFLGCSFTTCSIACASCPWRVWVEETPRYPMRCLSSRCDFLWWHFLKGTSLAYQDIQDARIILKAASHMQLNV